MGHKRHSAEVKAAVMAALLQGQGVTETSQEFGVPIGTVGRWKKALGEKELERLGNEKQDELGNLLMGYLRQNIKTLTIQSRFAANEKWLNRQSAESVAVLHGVMADKSVRLLEAIQTVDETPRGTVDIP